MADMKTKFRDARYFTILDSRNAFNFIRIKQKNEWKTAFSTKYGIYENLVIPFRLTNAPTTMQKMVNKALQSYLDRFAIIYMDNILVYSNTKNQYIRHVKMISENENREMQVPCQRNNVFGIYHYPRKHSNKNDKSGQYPDVRDLVKEVRDDRQGMFRRLFANIYVLSKYTRRTTKN